MGLSIKIVISINNIIYIPLAKLINFECIFPSKLKHTIVTLIFKKGDINTPARYRPISLLPIFSKVVERCMAVRMAELFEANNLFSECQFGFRQG